MRNCDGSVGVTTVAVDAITFVEGVGDMALTSETFAVKVEPAIDRRNVGVMGNSNLTQYTRQPFFSIFLLQMKGA